MAKKQRLYSAEEYAVLAAIYGREGTSVNHENVGAYRTKVVKAGDFLYVSCYPLVTLKQKWAQDAVMREKMAEMNVSARARYARYNRSRRLTRFEQLVHANFWTGDLHVCCTYGENTFGEMDGSPDVRDYRSRAQAKEDLRRYIGKIRKLLKKNGLDASKLKWLAVTATKEYDDANKANAFHPLHHHHILLHGVPEEYRNAIEDIWTHGRCNADRLQADDKGIADMAQYIARQEGKNSMEFSKHERSYSCSRNLEKPEVKTSDSRISRRRVMKIAEDVRVNGREIFGKLYPDYVMVRDEPVQVKQTDYVVGAYIYAKLRRKEAQAHPWERVRRRAR